MRASILIVTLLLGMFDAESGKVEEAAEQGEKIDTASPSGGVVVRPAVIQDIRTLFRLQDAAASGNQQAASLQKPLLGQIRRKLSEKIDGDPNVLAPYVAGYVLGGGNPQVAEQYSGAEGISSRNRNLLAGVAFFMKGQKQEAAEKLSEFDLASLSPEVAGRLALANAVIADEDHEKKQSLLSIAAASMPGSLVEESSLRRSALDHAMVGKEVPMWSRLERYLRRFPNSIYAANFLSEMMIRIVKLESDGKRPSRERLEVILNGVTPSMRRRLYFHLARQAAAKNLIDLAEFAGRRLDRLSVVGSQEQNVGRLYMSIFEVATDRSDQAAASLQAIDRKSLPEREAGLLDASLALVKLVQSPLVEQGTAEDVPTDEASDSVVVERAKTSLENAEKLLAEVLQ